MIKVVFSDPLRLTVRGGLYIGYFALLAAKYVCQFSFLSAGFVDGFSMQALPMRIGDVARKMTDALRARHFPISLSTLSDSSLLAIFSAPSVTFRPSLLT